MPKFKASVCRISYGFHEIEVEAQNEAEAREKILEEAGDYEFSEKSSDYTIEDGVSKVEEEVLSFNSDILSEKQLWALIEKANWKSDNDYRRIQKEFKSLGEDKFEQISEFIYSKVNELHSKFKEEWLKSISVSDDGWSDLRAEIVGRGEKFYKNITVKKMIKMAENLDYNESFTYSLLS